MQEPAPPPPARRLWDRPATRRALLAGSAAVAAAGTASAIVGVAMYGGDGSQGTASAAKGEPPAPTPVPDELARPIADPRRRAAHLLRRAGFGGTMAEVDEFAKLSREEAADRLLNFETVDNSALNARIETQQFNLTTPPGNRQDMIRWWLMRMAYTARPLEERMTLMWHGLLTSQVSKVGPQRAKLLVQQNELFRKYALPKYDDLLKAVSKDPAMLIYLDTVDSTREHPNENYARELMELFSMGVGNYTEDDIRESARAFTGWRLTAPPRQEIPPGLSEKERRDLQNKYFGEYDPQFFVAQRQHDPGTKTFLGKTGPWSGEDIVDIIMQHPASSRFMARRLFTEFANFNPDEKTIDGLVKVWDQGGHQVRDVVRAILVSDEFYSERSYRAIVRSPIEVLVGLVRALEIDTDFKFAQRAGFVQMDQLPFEPPNVAGWPGGSTWLSSSTFFARVNFLDGMLIGNGRNLIPLPALRGIATPEELVDAALARLVDGNVAPGARDAIVAYAKTVNQPDLRAAGVAYLVAASPEFQLV